jgi:pyruvate ferredoxin oxidoreductase alpha subunit
MTRQLLTGNGAAAWGARLARADYIPAFPITPQTEIIETLAGWIDTGAMKAKLVTLESEHSMVTAAGSAAAAGVRVFTATSSQGLLYAMEMLYSVAGWRVPFVLVNVSRALAAPLTLEPDHNDVLAARDSGFLQIHCATCQEVLDTVLLAFRLAEHREVRLPVIVNLDGFYLSFTREPVEIPDQELADRYLKPFDDLGMGLGGRRPLSQGVAVLGGAPYSYFRYQSHLASLHALDLYDELAGEYHRVSGRSWPVIEAYRTEDAEFVYVMAGCFATKAKAAADALRERGVKAGLLRPRFLRPFPAIQFRRMLEGIKAAAVIDQNISPGKGGILYTELASALYSTGNHPFLASFIGGLGGRDISQDELLEIAKVTLEAFHTGKMPEPRLLFTSEELLQVRNMQAIAGAANMEAGEAT